MKLLVLPGDGVGPEVTAEALRILRWFAEHRGLTLEVTERGFGLVNWERHGTLMPDETWARIEEAEAILFGAVGSLDQQAVIPPEERRKGSLLRMRKGLDLYANIRPIRLPEALLEASPLKPRVARGADFVILRELTAGMYFGTPRGVETLPDGTRRGVNTHSYTEGEIARAIRFACRLARERRGHVTSVDKANVMEAGALWREVAGRVAREEFPDVTLENMLADNCAIQIARDPRRFDVIVTDNLFGDLLSDAGGAILGSLGMLPSASVNDRGQALYEPVHGSAPDIAGEGIANPLGAILSAALLLRWSAKQPEDAAMLERAVDRALDAGARTADIAAPGEPAVSTSGMGDAVLRELSLLQGEA
ncbi:3-isopropylmalate dehydrogenase [Sabulicella rubraurantiaca]|uniref:3-isopropylmalate dehydrogenase n=1 Tax=Sabulicella rubraurantiaca TaxID=2811429 RepID=UPI001A97445D|nr:3-isopropylmalate dehydrogenase [Sabulicella rubraurantiaca]